MSSLKVEGIVSQTRPHQNRRPWRTRFPHSHPCRPPRLHQPETRHGNSVKMVMSYIQLRAPIH